MSIERTQIKDNPASEFKCPKCGFQFEKRVIVTGDGKPKKGQVWICGQCVSFLVLGDTTLRPMDKEEFKKLHPEDQRKILLKGYEIKQMITSEGKWSPFAEK